MPRQCASPQQPSRTLRGDEESTFACRRLTGFTNTQEAGVGHKKNVPFLIKYMFKANVPGRYEGGLNWGSYVVNDGKLITGYKAASSKTAAGELLKLT